MAIEASAVPEALAGEVVQRDPAGGQHDADQRRGVLEGDRLGRRVRGDLQVLEEARAPGRRPPGSSWRTALSQEVPFEDEAQRQHRVGDREAAERLGREDRLDPLEDRVAGTQHEDADRRDQRPEVALHAVAERVLPVGRLLAPLQRGHQEDLVEGVGERVRRLGEHGGRARDRVRRRAWPPRSPGWPTRPGCTVPVDSSAPEPSSPMGPPCQAPRRRPQKRASCSSPSSSCLRSRPRRIR